jgi:hypothetical protein
LSLNFFLSRKNKNSPLVGSSLIMQNHGCHIPLHR